MGKADVRVPMSKSQKAWRNVTVELDRLREVERKAVGLAETQISACQLVETLGCAVSSSGCPCERCAKARELLKLASKEEL